LFLGLSSTQRIVVFWALRTMDGVTSETASTMELVDVRVSGVFSFAAERFAIAVAVLFADASKPAPLKVNSERLEKKLFSAGENNRKNIRTKSGQMIALKSRPIASTNLTQSSIDMNIPPPIYPRRIILQSWVDYKDSLSRSVCIRGTANVPGLGRGLRRGVR
jgi:hypothetical protein